MVLAVGRIKMVGVALFTVTLTKATTVLKFVESVGVKVTLCGVVPTLGTVAMVVKANRPPTEALPPLNMEEASVCP